MTDWIKLANAADVPEGEVRAFEYEDYELVLCHVEGGDFYVIDDLCSHDNGPLGRGKLSGCEIECPRHLARFDVRTGKPVNPPAVFPVESYEVRNSDGVIEVKLD